MARAGATAHPEVPAPPALRPYLTFLRMTPRSLDMVARVVDGDDEFRTRVAAQVSEVDVGRAGWLWLQRPEGWVEELAEIESAWAAEQAVEAGARDERTAARKLVAVREALARAEAEVAGREASLAAARSDLVGERAARVEAERRVAELEAEVATAAAARADVVRNLKATEARAVARATELNAARAQVRDLEARLAALGSAPDRTTGSDHAAAEAAVDPAPGEAAVPDSQDIDPATLAREVARAAGGAAALADALGRLAAMLGTADATADPGGLDDGPAPEARRVASAGEVGESGAACVPPTPASDASVHAVRRVPVMLPGGVFDDTPEAAEYLLRTPGIVLVVDGYNVSMQGWPELTVADQRRRLVTALVDLAARTATPVEVVFDGAEVDPMSLPAPRRQLVRVRFSEPDVEADDVVIDLVASIPAATPVVVASSDRRVRERSRRGGANLLHADQLVALVRR